MVPRGAQRHEPVVLGMHASSGGPELPVAPGMHMSSGGRELPQLSRFPRPLPFVARRTSQSNPVVQAIVYASQGTVWRQGVTGNGAAPAGVSQKLSITGFGSKFTSLWFGFAKSRFHDILQCNTKCLQTMRGAICCRTV